MTAEWTPEDVELVARALAKLAYGDAADEHGPWTYTEFGTLCTCGAPIIKDEKCITDWDVMAEADRDDWRRDAGGVLAALAEAGRLAPAGEPSLAEVNRRIDACFDSDHQRFLARQFAGWAWIAGREATPARDAVVEAAKAWAAQRRHGDGDGGRAYACAFALIAAVDRLAETGPPTTPEPPHTAVEAKPVHQDTPAAEAALMNAHDDLVKVAERLEAKGREPGGKVHLGMAAGVRLACFRLIELADAAGHLPADTDQETQQ